MAQRFCYKKGGYVVNITSETEHFALVNEIGKTTVFDIPIDLLINHVYSVYLCVKYDFL